MPKRSVYFKGEEDELYVRVKELAEKSEETIASIFVNAMQSYVVRKEKEHNDLDEIVVFHGERTRYLGDLGENITFVGREIAKDQREEGDIERYGQVLYRTRKQKLLLLHEKIDDDGVVSTYKIYESMQELKDVNLLPGITKGLKNEKIGVRFLDI